MLAGSNAWGTDVDYTWVNGVLAPCYCGKQGDWYWKNGRFEIYHDSGETKCTTGGVTKTQERVLRRERGRKKVY